MTPAATLRILVRDFESYAFNRNGSDFYFTAQTSVLGLLCGIHRSGEQPKVQLREAVLRRGPKLCPLLTATVPHSGIPAISMLTEADAGSTTSSTR